MASFHPSPLKNRPCGFVYDFARKSTRRCCQGMSSEISFCFVGSGTPTVLGARAIHMGRRSCFAFRKFRLFRRVCGCLGKEAKGMFFGLMAHMTRRHSDTRHSGFMLSPLLLPLARRHQLRFPQTQLRPRFQTLGRAGRNDRRSVMKARITYLAMCAQKNHGLVRPPSYAAFISLIDLLAPADQKAVFNQQSGGKNPEKPHEGYVCRICKSTEVIRVSVYGESFS